MPLMYRQFEHDSKLAVKERFFLTFELKSLIFMRYAAMEGLGFRQSLDAAVGAGPLFFSGLLTRTKDQQSGLEWLGEFSSIPLVCKHLLLFQR
jgi:hypothetical protein